MSKKSVLESKEILQLKKKIEFWKRNKTTQRMPEKLWVQATKAAQLYGAAPVSVV